jgi:hypothetical protein
MEQEVVLAYYSRKLSEAENQYSTYDKELLVIKKTLNHWKYF